MPKRPPSHQLEDRSKKAFRRLFPDQWVIRDKSHDYGIDQEVEIFSPDGATTGILFLAQIKATAKSTKAVQISKDHLDYWNSHDTPVLVFRFVDSEGKFYFRWAEEIHRNHNQDGKSISVGFSEEDAWSDAAIALIEQKLKMRRALKRMTPETKILVTLRIEVTSLHERYPLRAAAEKALQMLKTFRLVDEVPSNEFSLGISIRDGAIAMAVKPLMTGSIKFEDHSEASVISSVSYGDAACLFLIAGLRNQTDSEAWVSMLGSIANSPPLDHVLFCAFVSTALFLGGEEVFSKFREQALSQGISPNILAPLEDLVLQVRSQIRNSRGVENLRMRFPTDEEKYVFVDVPI